MPVRCRWNLHGQGLSRPARRRLARPRRPSSRPHALPDALRRRRRRCLNGHDASVPVHDCRANRAAAPPIGGHCLDPSLRCVGGAVELGSVRRCLFCRHATGLSVASPSVGLPVKFPMAPVLRGCRLLCLMHSCVKLSSMVLPSRPVSLE